MLGTKIILPDVPTKERTRYQKQKLREGFKRRAAIEPRIGHLKQDHRLGRNFYKGIKGDNINVMLAAAAMNFKRIMNKWKLNPHLFLSYYFLAIIDSLKIRYAQFFKIPLKMSF